MSLHLPNRTNCPPGGWSYHVPETNTLFRGEPSEHGLLVLLKQHYRVSGIEVPPDLIDRVEAYICEKNPAYCGDEVAIQAQSPSGSMHTAARVVQCLRTLVANLAGSGERVTPALAETRAATCANCSFNEGPSDCTRCRQGVLSTLVQKIVGARKTLLDDQLHACKICHCDLRGKIWVTHSAVERYMTMGQKQQLPANCWILTEKKP